MKDYNALAAKYKNSGRFDKAIDCLKKASTRQKGSLGPHFATLEVYLWKQDHEKADALAERIFRKSPDVKTSCNLAELYRSNRLQEKANRWSRRCVEIDPDHYLSHMQQILMLASTGQRSNLADYCAHIDCQEGEKQACFWELMCKSLTEAKQLDQAKPLVREALKRFARPFEQHAFHALLAQIAYREQEAEKAMELMRTQRDLFTPFVSKDSRSGASLQLQAIETTLKRVKDPHDMLPGGDGAGQQMVYAIGPPRAGTTLLESFLAGHPDVVTLNEPNLATRVINVNCGARHTFPKESLLTGEAQLGEAKAALLRDMILGGIPAHTSEDHFGKTIVDKSPLLGSHVYLLAQIFPAGRFLAILRDPRDAAISYYLTHYFQPLLPEASMCETLEGTFRLLVSLSLIPWHLHQREPARCHVLTYEELVQRPAELMQECFRFMGLEDFDAVGFALSDKTPRAMNSLRPRFAKGIRKERKGIWKDYEKYFDFLTPEDSETLAVLGYE